MKFIDLLENFIKTTRKKLGAGRKPALPYNPALNKMIIGEDPHSKINRDRRYKRRHKRLGKF